jgi:hypothetical protein
MAPRFAAALVLVSGMAFSLRADDPPDDDVGGTGEIQLDTPNISGTGPYTVVVKGTLSIDKNTTGFVGTKASVKGTVVTYNASVSLPKGNPEPGKGTVPVEYTWSSMPYKGSYSGDAILEFKDAVGKTKSVKATVSFEIK